MYYLGAVFTACLEWGILWFLFGKTQYIKENDSEICKKKKKIQILIRIFITITAGISSFYATVYATNLYSGLKIVVSVLGISACMLVDLYTYRIPNRFLGYLVCARIVIMLLEFIGDGDNLKDTIFNSLIGMFFMFALMFLLYVLTRHGIGMGDVKMLSVLGLLTGLRLAINTLFLGVLLCGAGSSLLLIFKKKSIKDNIPFGPFLYGGLLISIVTGAI